MQTQLSQYTAVIGIDWADKKHDVCVQDMATGKRRASQVRHRPERPFAIRDQDLDYLRISPN